MAILTATSPKTFPEWKVALSADRKRGNRAGQTRSVAARAPAQAGAIASQISRRCWGTARPRGRKARWRKIECSARALLLLAVTGFATNQRWQAPVVTGK